MKHMKFIKLRVCQKLNKTEQGLHFLQK